MYSWHYDPNYVTVTMGTTEEDTKKQKVKIPSKYDHVVFKPSEEEERERVELERVLNEPPDEESEGSVDLRHTTHSLKRQLRFMWCKRALIGLVVALLLAVVITVVLVVGNGRPEPSPGLNSTTKAYEDCKPNQFTCSAGECIPDGWRCDDVVDCRNGEDEKICENYTTSAPRSCQAWKEEFQIDCPPSGCPFYPICTPTGHWDPVQCTTDNSSCWCVDWATGATVPGSFVKDVATDGRPFCEMPPA